MFTLLIDSLFLTVGRDMGVRFLYDVHKEVKGDIHDDVLGALSPRRESSF